MEGRWFKNRIFMFHRKKKLCWWTYFDMFSAGFTLELMLTFLLSLLTTILCFNFFNNFKQFSYNFWDFRKQYLCFCCKNIYCIYVDWSWSLYRFYFGIYKSALVLNLQFGIMYVISCDYIDYLVKQKINLNY